MASFKQKLLSQENNGFLSNGGGFRKSEFKIRTQVFSNKGNAKIQIRRDKDRKDADKLGSKMQKSEKSQRSRPFSASNSISLLGTLGENPINIRIRQPDDEPTQSFSNMISPSTNAEGMLQFNEAIAEVDEEGLEHKKIARPISNYTAANYKIRQSKKGHQLVIDNANY